MIRSPVTRAISAAQRAASRLGHGETIIYHRGPDRIEIADAIRRRPEYIVDETGGTRISHEDLDWTIFADSLIFAGKLSTPAKGDRIKTLSGETYEVLPRDREECFRWEAGQVSFRVYAKRVSD